MKKFLLLTATLFTLKASAQIEKADINELLFKQGGLLYEHAEYGVSIGIINGKHKFFISSGHRANPKQLVDSSTLFEIGSVTKTFTSLLLAQQITKGRIKENSYIDSYLPAKVTLQPQLRHKVKMTDLASFQSGLPNLSNDQYIQDLFKQNPSQPFSLVTPSYIYHILSTTQALNGHGTYQYNNYSYALLGLLLGNATRQSYAQLLQNTIIKPLGLRNTTLGRYGTKDVAGRFNGDGKPQPQIIVNAVAPAGGLISNAADMVKYLQFQLDFAAMKSPNAVELTHHQFYKDDKHVIGLGWEINPHYLEKSGDTFGNSSLLRFDSRHRIGVVILSDHKDSKFVEDVADAIFQQLDKDM